jgi:L,D-peptidoglycan transpeptidase YkuD (ErfK/YbiS/YcfS/YnhG family)
MPMLSRIRVQQKPAAASRGWLLAGALALPVALGRGGIKANKREGDGATPASARRDKGNAGSRFPFP